MSRFCVFWGRGDGVGLEVEYIRQVDIDEYST